MIEIKDFKITRYYFQISILILYIVRDVNESKPQQVTVNVVIAKKVERWWKAICSCTLEVVTCLFVAPSARLTNSLLYNPKPWFHHFRDFYNELFLFLNTFNDISEVAMFNKTYITYIYPDEHTNSILYFKLHDNLLP